MDVRYQVFVSSTFADLEAERQNVIRTLMEMDCIPAGMELFPAIDDEQWEFIKKIIDDCDYYILIMGGRYGSVTADGISFTEKEYDYALSKNIKVICLLHGDPNSIPVGKTDASPELAAKLKAFRDRVSAGRLVRFWKSAEELPGIVALSLAKTIKTYPATGWVRADRAASRETLAEINELRKEIGRLRESAPLSRRALDGVNIAGLDENFAFTVRINDKEDKKISMSWKRLFGLLAPEIQTLSQGSAIRKALIGLVAPIADHIYSRTITDEVFSTIRIQLTALGLITVKKRAIGTGLDWELTDIGEQMMFESRVIPSQASE
ncbi:DUF4062 domain-containing protein [Rhizobium sp. WYCCWR 11279]|uniref:DUF4062 domain-containing protein n=1 Tax=Rhizobium changzhiense TaxID=2692317 RepID=UPI001492A74C|nr:DUF4062 domain-containing protein [Rhizobium changzhiense]NNU46721.1 DUF4062 domain-containing protein [Rhizobium changzhiense]